LSPKEKTLKTLSKSNLGSAVVKLISLVAVVSAVVAVTNSRLETLRADNEVARQGFISAADRSKQLECLTRNVYWESAMEPFEGKVAVAQVTINRVESGRFAKDICGVVYQKNVVYDRVVCQFSWFCDGSSKIRPIHPAHWKEAEEVAKKVLLEGFRLPSMKNALYFHADYVKPQWGKPQVGKIGRHIFYAEKI
jgi:spore germination cell wall hydrolase CwlJ-like protein